MGAVLLRGTGQMNPARGIDRHVIDQIVAGFGVILRPQQGAGRIDLEERDIALRGFIPADPGHIGVAGPVRADSRRKRIGSRSDGQLLHPQQVAPGVVFQYANASMLNRGFRIPGQPDRA